MEILDIHKRQIQSKIEEMTSGSEMLFAEVYKPYIELYPIYAVYEEVQRVLKLNFRRYKLFKRDPLTASIIGRTEDFV